MTLCVDTELKCSHSNKSPQQHHLDGKICVLKCEISTVIVCDFTAICKPVLKCSVNFYFIFK